MASYGNEYVNTPNIDRLADEGFRYTQCYSSGAVCSASRSSWITGMLASSTGLMHHRSRVRIPKHLKLYPQVLSEAGYFTANAGKHDYNIDGRNSFGWQEDAKQVKTGNPAASVNWSKLFENQPFFQVINCYESHESRAMGIDHMHDSSEVNIPPYHPDTQTIRANYAHYYDAIERMDREVGGILEKLKNAGLAENTIVIYNSDHGGPLPRGKRYLFNSGTHCPLIVRIPEKYKELWPAETPGTAVNRLVSFMDMPVTWIALAGGKIPENYHGVSFLSAEETPEPKYHFSFRGRNDERIENVRAIRDKRFLYVKNYFPYVPRGQFLSYQWKIPMQHAWETEYRERRTNAHQSRYFEAQSKKSEELYDTLSDPHCLNNLAENPEYSATLSHLSSALAQYQKETIDAGLLPESEIIKLARKQRLTVYGYVREAGNYNLPTYLDAADIALEANPRNLPKLVQFLESQDVGQRYWGASGLQMLGKNSHPAKAPLRLALKDSSHNVRLMAAWALINMGDSTEAVPAIQNLLKNNSYAMLEILNVIDWMGEAGNIFLPQLRKLKSKKGGIRTMRDYLLQSQKS